jgi:hypothetical protein
MQNVIIKKAIELKLTANDWQLYTATRDCNLVAAILNTKIADIINASTNKDEAYNQGCKFLEDYSEFGAGDTEPRYVLRNILAEFFGD